MIEGEMMPIVSWFFIGMICFIVIKSILDFVRGDHRFSVRLQDSRFSVELFYTLLIIYTVVIIGFGLIYFILSIQGIILVEFGEKRQVDVFGSIVHSIYFSGVTLLTIGYGDITPIGIGRFLAIVEALIGYILPTAFVLKLVQSQGRMDDKNDHDKQ
ncbi:MAG TPA: potassium channel family protein [Bacillota bacterium]|nr:potassium channel family protein [Bacillota bacterium]